MKNIYQFVPLMIFLVLIQVLFLNQIDLFGYIDPFIYLILIIILPQNIEKWMILIFGVSTGILLDLFEGNLGLNMASLVFISYLKPYLQIITIPRNSVDEKEKLNLKILGFRIFSIHALSIIFFHNLFLFILDYFQNFNILFILFKITASSIITYIFILIIQIFSYKSKN